ncbi:MAG: hypothetical protein JNK89_05925 [Saprospiraceae bacterium]|nr:hypothetical protein [Saprospiraceae bacterium]
MAFSFVYGVNVLRELGMNPGVLRVGNDNLFQSEIFSSTIATLLGCRIEMLRTTGATGAAIAAGVGIGLWPDAGAGLGQLERVRVFEPAGAARARPLEAAFADWEERLQSFMNNNPI